MISIDQKESRIRDLRLMKHISRNVELKVIKNVLNANYALLQQRKTALKEEYKKLDNVNHNVWSVEDKFCNEIWNFSVEHNFNAFFEHYPNVSEVIKSHKCKYDTVTENYPEDIDIDKKSVLTELENEIDTINNEIVLMRNKNIEQDIKNATSTLNNLKSFSEEISDLIRLINASENSQNVCNVSTYQQLNTVNVTEGFENAKKLLRESNFPSRVIIGKKVTTNLRKMIEKPKNAYNMRCNVQDDVKFGKFVMKKRSLISLKFEHKLKIE